MDEPFVFLRPSPLLNVMFCPYQIDRVPLSMSVLDNTEAHGSSLTCRRCVRKEAPADALDKDVTRRQGEVYEKCQWRFRSLVSYVLLHLSVYMSSVAHIIPFLHRSSDLPNMHPWQIAFTSCSIRIIDRSSEVKAYWNTAFTMRSRLHCSSGTPAYIQSVSRPSPRSSEHYTFSTQRHLQAFLDAPHSRILPTPFRTKISAPPTWAVVVTTSQTRAPRSRRRHKPPSTSTTPTSRRPRYTALCSSRIHYQF
jgi:hypothetical protein